MKIGITCSCFDLFHAGHIMMLKEAKSVCDYLIVGLQTDPTIDRKEKNKPIQSVFERFVQLQACKYVDEVVIFDEDNPLRLIQDLRPDIIVKGGDYLESEVVGNEIAEVVIFNTIQGYSTTKLIKQLAASFEEGSSNK